MTRSSRSEPTRRNVVNAAGKAISSNGLHALRLRQIAANANMSPGLVLYHYPEHVDLMLAVHEEVVAQYFEIRRAAQQGLEDPKERLIRVVMAGVPPYAPDETVRLLYEMHGLARQSPRHAELMSDLWKREVELYTEIIDSGVATGDFTFEMSTADVAAVLLGLEDGLALHLTSNNTELNAATAVSLFLGVAAVQLGCPALHLKSSDVPPKL
jgi:AcrR family transcriptional regulator